MKKKLLLELLEIGKFRGNEEGFHVKNVSNVLFFFFFVRELPEPLEMEPVGKFLEEGKGDFA